MQKLFTKILLPVALNRNTRWAVDKTIQLANKFDCDIVLLHVRSPFDSIPFFQKTYHWHDLNSEPGRRLENEMKELELQASLKLKDGLLIRSVVRKGSWQQMIKDTVISEDIDLVLIPRSHRTFGSAVLRRININKLSLQTNCPILTLTRNINVNHLQNIVVPIHDRVPLRTLSMATYLSFENNGCIYLVGPDEHKNMKIEKGSLFKAYQLLNDYGRVNIQCAINDNEDLAADALSFARQVKANLILIDPGKVSRLKGWWNKLRGKYLYKESDIPVMTVAI